MLASASPRRAQILDMLGFEFSLQPTDVEDGQAGDENPLGVTGNARNVVAWRIGHATSADGLTWTRSGDTPVLDVGKPVQDERDATARPTAAQSHDTTKRPRQRAS